MAFIWLVIAAVAFGKALTLDLMLEPSQVSGFSDQYRSQNNLGEYSFGYNEDHTSGGSFRRETSDRHGHKMGSYGLRVADGRIRVVNYVADRSGFRADVVSNEPGMLSQTSNGHLKVTSTSLNRVVVPGLGYLSRAPHTFFEAASDEGSGDEGQSGNLANFQPTSDLVGEGQSESSIRNSDHLPTTPREAQGARYLTEEGHEQEIRFDGKPTQREVAVEARFDDCGTSGSRFPDVSAQKNIEEKSRSRRGKTFQDRGTALDVFRENAGRSSGAGIPLARSANHLLAGGSNEAPQMRGVDFGKLNGVRYGGKYGRKIAASADEALRNADSHVGVGSSVLNLHERQPLDDGVEHDDYRRVESTIESPIINLNAARS